MVTKPYNLSNRLNRISALGIGVATVTILVVGGAVAPASAIEMWGRPVEKALADVTKTASTPGETVMANVAAATSAGADSEIAVATSAVGVDVVIPTKATDPVVVGSKTGGELAVTVPENEKSADADTVATNVVLYNQNNGAHTAVVPKGDGSVQLLSVIENRKAPTDYEYGLNIDGSLRLEVMLDGSVAGFNAAGVPVLAVAPPWATDANGKSVSTRYEIRDSKLVQVVGHHASGVAYPVVADPQIMWFPWGYATKFSYSETRQIASAASNAGALAIMCGLIASAPGAVACGIAGFLIGSFAKSWVAGVVARGHCLQINTPWFIPGIPYEVTC